MDEQNEVEQQSRPFSGRKLLGCVVVFVCAILILIGLCIIFDKSGVTAGVEKFIREGTETNGVRTTDSTVPSEGAPSDVQ